MKKKLLILLSVSVLAFAAGCSPASDANEEVSIANPWNDASSLEEAIASAGFEMNIPESVADQSISLIQWSADPYTIQVFYGDDAALIRKGNVQTDISGDYNEYSMMAQVPLNDQSDAVVTMKGNGDLYNTAFWSEGDFSYSVHCVQGLSRENMIAVCQEVF